MVTSPDSERLCWIGFNDCRCKHDFKLWNTLIKSISIPFFVETNSAGSVGNHDMAVESITVSWIFVKISGGE